MCNVPCIVFGAVNLSKEEVKGRDVIDIGSLDDNGSIRPIIESWLPSRYVGVDIVPGKGVDIICDAVDVFDKFGKDSFDIVISMNALEHIQDYKKAISNIKNVCRPNGIIVLVMPAPGFPYHAHPSDWWRFSAQDINGIFSDCEVQVVEEHDNLVYTRIRKPKAFKEKGLRDFELYNIVAGKRVKEIENKQTRTLRFLFLNAREKLRGFLHKIAKPVFK